MESYFGLDLNISFRAPIIAPGVLSGASYKLNETFAVFGEVGFNVFVIGDNDAAYLGMANTGIGVKVSL